MSDNALRNALAELVPDCSDAIGDWNDVLRRADITGSFAGSSAASKHVRVVLPRSADSPGATAASLRPRRLRVPRARRNRLLLSVLLVLFMLLATSAVAVYKVVQGSPSYPRPVAGTFAELARTVSAIDRARTSDDALTAKAAQVVASMADQLPPDAAQQAMRVYTSPVCGPVYVLPAKQGFALISGAGALGTFAEIVPGTLGETDPGAGGAFYSSSGPSGVCGIATDDVVSVDVVVGAHIYQATMLRNGYEWLAPRASRVLSLRFHLKDGSVVYG
jgi:hypothetical protein